MAQREIKDLKLECAERSNHKMIGELPIRFVPTEKVYDNPENISVFSISLNLYSSTTTEK